jgi:plastocyanin
MRRSLSACICIVCFADLAAASENTGTIQGAIRFTGAIPPAKQLPTGDGAFIEHYDLVVDAKTKGLRWVIVAVEDAPAQPKIEGEATPSVIDQRNMLFAPRVIAIQHGRPVRFDNSDQCNHSVNTAGRLTENQINVFVKANEPLTKTFLTEKTAIRVGCALHPSMTAWIYVAQHPWVAVTDEKGAFTIKNVPAGKYTLLLRHPDTGLGERQQIEVRDGKTLELAVEWKEANPMREPPKPGAK